MVRLSLLLLLCVCLVCPVRAYAQLRPLDPVDFRAFSGPALHFQAGGGVFFDQHASLAGTRGTLIEAGDFRATIRTGRVLVDLGGTVQRFFEDEDVLAPPYGEARAAPDDGKRHDAGDYRVGAVVRLTPDASSTIATLRFGTRLPTTDNRVGLDRDAIDFFATLAAHRQYARLSVALEAGLGIHGTRKIDYEQSDVLLYAVSASFDAQPLAPFIIALGQQDFQEFAVRGNEDLAEIRAGVRAGKARWISAAWVHGLAEYSPSGGFQLMMGSTFGGK